MTASWQMVPLGDLLTKSEESTEIRPDCRYKQVTVRLWGEGVAERNEVSGAEIAGARRRVVRRGQLLLSRIDARNGAFGIVPDNLDGAVVSNDFPAFRLQPDHVVPAYLGWLSKTHAFVALCGAASEGTTNRVRLKQDRFLAMTIPLPPLSEQHRIVGRIEELAAKVREARDLRRETLDTAESLLAAEELRIWPKEQLRGAPHLGDITVFLARGRQSRQGESEHYLIKTQHVQMGRYVRSEIRLDPDVAVKVAPEATVKQGDVLIACSAAGCLGRVAYYTDTDRVASTDTHVAIARADCRVIAPEYLYAYLKGAQGQLQLRSRERGDWRREKVGFRLTELNLADLKRVPVPVPSLSEQRLIVGYLDDLREKVDALRRLQRETAAELDAMLPSILDKAFKGEL